MKLRVNAMDTSELPTSNDDRQAELELAVAELAFWLDFAKWWRKKYCPDEEPRIQELLAQAEKRYFLAQSVATGQDNMPELDQLPDYAARADQK